MKSKRENNMPQKISWKFDEQKSCSEPAKVTDVKASGIATERMTADTSCINDTASVTSCSTIKQKAN
ncbi:MAG: hypothetical protein ACTFAL_16980 [Candidatus Electronema sp. V4]|uniref:hypothetical protein n=1 Tax=Candidatus Electronema sp. V4 TaxID=3454756 RepID=UPI0040557F67